MTQDVHADFELLKSLLNDFDKHIFAGKKHTTANVEVGQYLLEKDDVKRLLHPDFIERLQGRVNKCRTDLIKNARHEIELLRGYRR